MNQDQVKEILRKLESPPKDFKVIFSGKISKKVDGLYKPEECEIIIHNRNAVTENELLYTAIHEYAHHIQFCTPPLPLSTRTHNTRFWHLFHSLLIKAEELSLYSSPFDRHSEFLDLTKRIKEMILFENGKLMKEFGRLLLEARSLCEKFNANYEDYLDRILCIPRSSAKAVMKSHIYDLNPRIGFENMRAVARINEAGKRELAQNAIISGQSPEMIKMEFLSPAKPEEPLTAMMQERERLEKTIRSLNRRLSELTRRIEDFRRNED